MKGLTTQLGRKATFLGCGLALAALGLLGTSPAAADPPLNIILMVADDLGWNDLPYFSKPTDWTATDTAGVPNAGEPMRVNAPLNRFAARSFASPTANGGVHGLGSFDGSPDGSFEVEPIDQRGLIDHDQAGYVVDHEDCTVTDPAPPVGGDDGLTCLEGRDVMKGFGGMARLAAQGVVFPRFYANSAKCGPSRAALFTGRYPKRTGVTLNHAELSGNEVTIAEFLKQACGEGTEQCHKDGQVVACPSFRPSGSWPAGPACYHTGLIGKWHLGSEGGTVPWNQGFDEYFGFGGGSRHYWNTDPLQCSPAPGRCSQTVATRCDIRAPQPAGCPEGETCQPAGMYVGTQSTVVVPKTCRTAQYKPVMKDQNPDPDCCAFGGGDGTARGRYDVKHYLADDGAKGKDIYKDGNRPCSVNGLTKDTDCSYLERVLRDHARNFVVRNREFQPYFLTVAFHAPHFGFAAPLRTEAHYKSNNLAWNATSQQVEEPTPGVPIKVYSPSGPSKYWGIMEELDSAVGQILDVLDNTGVCEDDPSVGCTSDAACDEDTPGDGSPEDRCNDEPTNDCTGKCAAIGTCEQSPTNKVCMTNNDCTDGGTGTCLAMRERTLVLFTSDNGRPPFKSDYGDPDLRGGKGSIYEGGVRVGLLARLKSGTYRCSGTNEVCDPTDNECPSPQACEPGVTTPAVSSMVDVFATIAEAAGYTPNDNGHYKLLSGGVTRIVDGESFFDTLEDPFTASHEMREERSFVYASYPGDGVTAIASDDVFADTPLPGPKHVCGYESAAAGTRRVRGASCTACTPGNPDPCPGLNTWCKVPGSVCVDSDTPLCSSDLDGDGKLKEVCVTVPVDPDGADAGMFSCQRTPDCPVGSGDLECMREVYVKCNKCVAAKWKIRVKDSGETTDLYDLATNPTEDERMNCASATYASDLSNAFKTNPGAELSSWQSCVVNDCSTPY